MCFLQQLHQAVKVSIGHFEYVPPMILLRIARLNSIPPACNPHSSIRAQFKNDNNSLVPAMNMRGIVIARIHTECDSIELVRAHATRILRNRVQLRRRPLHSPQRLLQIRDQIFLVLNPDRQPNTAFGNPHRIAELLAHRTVRRGRRVRSQRLNATKRLCIQEDLDRRKEPRRFIARLELEAHHRTKALLLPRRELVLRMALQARIGQLAYLGMRGKIFGHRLPILLVLLDAQAAWS